mmetsp:Transcript_67678/g.153166  ORF Transcript_67678/g.153166 Transcript_67678/m.153166 type:complete len:279 (+) Transcript_67678:28-864(+)
MMHRATMFALAFTAAPAAAFQPLRVPLRVNGGAPLPRTGGVARLFSRGLALRATGRPRDAPSPLEDEASASAGLASSAAALGLARGFDERAEGRRAALSRGSLIFLAALSALAAPNAFADADAAPAAANAEFGAEALPTPPPPPVVAAAEPTTIEYSDFLEVLFRGEAAKVQFYGAEGDVAFLTTKEGKRLKVLGMAKASNNSDKGPLSTVARVRDAKVPFSFESFDLVSFRQGKAKGEGEFQLPKYLNPFEEIKSPEDLAAEAVKKEKPWFSLPSLL